jgi:hypothetical protein
VILKSRFLLVLCAELVAEIPSHRSAPCLYVTIHHWERLLTVRASGWRAADKISGVDHHIAAKSRRLYSCNLIQIHGGNISDIDHKLKTVTQLLQQKTKASTEISRHNKRWSFAKP